MAEADGGAGVAPVRRLAPAKVNLHLHVVGRRDDGYHLLHSLVAFAGVGDDIEVRPADGLSLSVAGPFAAAIPAGDDNLVLRAARALAQAAGVRRGAAIRLFKRLPPASGIGGGSSDAAATLRALAGLWGVSMADGDALALALRLGADVPVCLAGRAVHMAGIGERLEPAPALPEAWLALVNPGVPVATPAVFKARRGPFSDPAPLTGPFADARALARALADRRNDLEAPARALAPVIGAVVDDLAAQPGVLLARMSGSGATCFGLFADAATAGAAMARIAAVRPGWWVAAAPLVGDVAALETPDD